MDYFTYILYSEKLNKFYTGSTNNLERRFNDHNRGKTTFTKTGIPWKLVYFEKFTSRKEALQRETMIKKQKDREYIKRLIANSYLCALLL